MPLTRRPHARVRPARVGAIRGNVRVGGSGVGRSVGSILGIALLTFAVGGCGGSGGGAGGRSETGAPAGASSVNGVQQITIHTGDDLRFHPDTISVHPGQVRVLLVNGANSPPHDWQLPDFPADFVPLTNAGETKQATFTAPSPGRYQFVCTIHARQGQVGTLIVANR